MLAATASTLVAIDGVGEPGTLPSTRAPAGAKRAIMTTVVLAD
jgi:hypothetical protein